MPFQPTNAGYDTNAARRPAPGGANGWLRNLLDDTEVPMWVYEVQTGFAMAGSVGQSPRTRSLFPHNMEQQQFTVMAQFPNQDLYAQVVEFIRSMQYKLSSSLLLQVVNRSGYQGRKLKGVHRDLAVEGYVLRVPRAHRQFEYAPELRFDFVAERIRQPSQWVGEKIEMKMLQTWRDVIEKKEGTFMPVPDEPSKNVPVRPPYGQHNGEYRPG